MKRELERRGFAVALPAMPRPDHPIIADWIRFIDRLVGEPDAETIIVGHSLGCQAVVRYLDTIGAAGKCVAKTLLVAGSFPVARSREEAVNLVGEKNVLLPWFTEG